MKLISIFWSKIIFSGKDRIIYFYQLIGFGIYAIPGYANAINKYGVLTVFKGAMLFSIVMLSIELIIKFIKQSYEIRIRLKLILLDFTLIFMYLGYFLYYEYCSSIYLYMIPVVSTLFLILLKKVIEKKRPEDKE
ncbi:hypothetical protein [Ruminiclostridium cellobioparum]|uniref:Uncharacterized protein n=1 Tax=Ruminiclostridium cellobioparum subsp. termitidis CT1112 TaxID=1195236 RepID=S0FJK2_RUMCE|nr:hypothetical protein [Ruminiclostridium cellobioparum]EMS72320.1 hypothetical protein CTER_1709 [Ruminiclostridium cellobioparum subsp. termitidis CT1112]